MECAKRTRSDQFGGRKSGEGELPSERVVDGGVQTRIAWLALALGFGLMAGCRSAPNAVTVAPTSMPTSTTEGWAAPDPCSGLNGISSLETPVILEADCDPSNAQCDATLPLSVRNCTPEAVVIREVRLEELDPERAPTGAAVIYEPERRKLAPGEAWTYESFAAVGSFELIVVYREAGKSALQSQPLTVTHPRLAQAQDECRACEGDWGPHGMAGRVGCVCRTQDGGTTCNDGLDCEAQCISAGGGGFACSEFVTTFGCRSYLPDGWSLQPQGQFGRRVPHRCVD